MPLDTINNKSIALYMLFTCIECDNFIFIQLTEAQEEGRQTNILELYKVTHRHMDGSAISEAAERQIVSIITCISLDSEFTILSISMPMSFPCFALSTAIHIFVFIFLFPC